MSARPDPAKPNPAKAGSAFPGMQGLAPRHRPRPVACSSAALPKPAFRGRWSHKSEPRPTASRTTPLLPARQASPTRFLQP